MNIEFFSKKYRVRRLAEADISEIYKLCIGNPQYYEYCPPFVTKESIKRDLKALPSGKALEDKYYAGYYDNDTLVAILDIIDSFPDNETAFIGLFMTDKAAQGLGIGSGIIEELSVYLCSIGVKRVRLGWAKGNKQAESFWHKNGFKETGAVKDNGDYTAVIAQKELYITQEI